MSPERFTPKPPAEQAPSPETIEGKFIKNVTFQQDDKGRFRSSRPERKIIMLHPSSEQPIVGRLYTVEIMADSMPDKPRDGKYVVRIMSDRKRPQTKQEWENVEKAVNVAERIQKRLAKAERMLSKAKAEVMATADEITDDELEAILAQPTESGEKRKTRVAKRSLDQSKILKEELGAVLGAPGSPERDLIALRRSNLKNALWEYREIEKRRAELAEVEAAVLKELAVESSQMLLDELKEIRDMLGLIGMEEEDLMQSDPEAFVGLHLLRLKEYHHDLEQGRIVETPYVKEHAEDIYAHLRANQPVLIYGHLGTGKTELAMHVARQYLGKEALVISGSKYMSLAELYGHQVLTTDKMRQKDIGDYAKQVEDKFETWLAENAEALKGKDPEEREAEKNRAHDRFLQLYLTQFKGGTISDFYLGPVYRAMDEGRPVIIDEVNAIPHEVLISLNHILTRRAGDAVNVQQDSGKKIKVKEGFGVLMTANLNQGTDRYVDRQELDPAFLSRLYKVEYDYLPQAKEGALSESGEQNELFHVLIARMMDSHGALQWPKDSEHKLWNLAKAARATQDVFAGRDLGNAFYFRTEGRAVVPYFLNEAVLSLRAIDKIISAWQSDGYRYELDQYVWKEFVSQSTNAADKAYLYQLLQTLYDFFTSVKWDRAPDYGKSGKITSFSIAAPKNNAAEAVTMSPRDTTLLAFGQPPERQQWPANPFAEPAAVKAASGQIQEKSWSTAGSSGATAAGAARVEKTAQSVFGDPAKERQLETAKKKLEIALKSLPMSIPTISELRAKISMLNAQMFGIPEHEITKYKSTHYLGGEGRKGVWIEQPSRTEKVVSFSAEQINGKWGYLLHVV